MDSMQALTTTSNFSGSLFRRHFILFSVTLTHTNVTLEFPAHVLYFSYLSRYEEGEEEVFPEQVSVQLSSSGRAD